MFVGLIWNTVFRGEDLDRQSGLFALLVRGMIHYVSVYLFVYYWKALGIEYGGSLTKRSR